MRIAVFTKNQSNPAYAAARLGAAYKQTMVVENRPGAGGLVGGEQAARSAPRGLPAEVLRKLNADINAVLRLPELAQRWESLGVTPLGGTLDEAARRNALESQRWGLVITAAGIQVE